MEKSVKCKVLQKTLQVVLQKEMFQGMRMTPEWEGWKNYEHDFNEALKELNEVINAKKAGL
jgi:hypothetical protein